MIDFFNSYFSLISWLLLASMAVFVFFIIIQKEKSIKTWAIIRLSLSSILWMWLDMLTSYNFGSTDVNLYIWRLGFVVAFLMSLCALRFTIIIVRGKLPKFYQTISAILIIAVFLVTVFTDLIVKKTTTLEYFGQSNYIVGSLFFGIILLTVLPLIMGLILAGLGFISNKSEIIKRQSLYIFLGLLWPLIFGLISNLLAPMMSWEIPKMANIGVFLAMIFFGYAIYRWEMFDITMRKYKIKTKIISGFTLSFLAVLFIIGSIVAVIIFKNIEDQTISHLQTAANSRSAHIETYVQQNIERLKLITSRTALRKNLDNYNQNPNQTDLDSMTSIIKDASKSVTEFERVCILGLDGKVIASTDSRFPGRDVHDKEFFIGGKKKEGIYFVKEDGRYVIIISGPMIQENRLIGVGLSVVKLNNLTKIVKEGFKLGNSGEIVVAFNDSSGQRIYPISRLFENEAVNNDSSPLIAEPMKQALNKNEATFRNSFDYRGEKIMAVTAYVDSGRLGLVAKIDRQEALLPFYYIAEFSLVVLAIFLLFFYFVSKYIAGLITRPIEKLEDGVEIIKNGNLNYKVEIKSNDEIGELAQTFNSMVQSVKKSREEIDEKVNKQTKEIQSRAQDMENQQKAILNILEDVEGEKNKIELLAQDLEKFKLAVDNASDHIVITDPEGIVLYGNNMVQQITGYTLQEALGKKAGKLWRKPMEQAYYEKLWKRIKKDKKPFVGEITNIRKNGEEYEASISIAPVLDDKKQVVYFVGIERDISKEKQIDKVKTEFVSLASHQLRTPLSTINWYAEMLLNGDAGKLNPEQNNYLQEIYRGNQRMVSLVNALLNVSRLELGTFMIEPKSVDICQIAKIAIDELLFKISEKKLKFSQKFDKIPLMQLDEKLTLIIFQNLLSNAVKYTPEKGEVKISICKKEKNVEITVKDSGLGIPEEQKDKIFTKLFRADNVRQSDAEGTGLGLYIIKSIIEQTGGKIKFISKQNAGTTFIVDLPLSGMKKKEGTKTID